MKNNLSRTINKVAFKVKKYSPEICVVLGVAGMVTSAVMACKATLKVNDILEETKQTVDSIKEVKEKADELPEGVTYSEEDSKKDLTIAYCKTGVKLAKLYAPSVILGTLSIGSIVASNVIMKKRNVALAATCTAVTQSFKDYRERVVEKFGEEVDKKLKYGIKAVEIEKEITDEDGNTRMVKETKEVVTDKGILEGYSEFAKFFDELSDYWEDDPDYNLMFLRRVEDEANRMLEHEGFLFLNDVYGMLGIPKTRGGQVYGWIYDKDVEHKIDFGIYDINRLSNRKFVNGYESAILLDFHNLDGNIWEKM